MTSFGEPITVTTRAKQVDADGNPVLDEFNNPVYLTTSVTVSGAFAPAIGYETTNSQDQVVTQPTAYLPAGMVVTSLSKLTIRGQDYEVDGDPQDWRSPFTGWAPGIVVPLKRTSG